ncbi:NAD(P)-dependent oxidoreductase [Geoalkalibacter halelectricus]|uniref:NAD(P)-dependent oxidoreductase n=1 Tax=Geoalkalibacter halelectricus TaxID=2847045 RepID=A0ABY5ZKX0_9BACT|nr:NAD(P)-dependent oxidoreductase [Geoalkalibacter halelectricus]MDO3378100.1 NAD(P)-dependent oxidoreductase [Geoalkalibacter halelectricus]UWZ78394.1 NAD(P)-dependent oxidoreductase [Geoalkalibacter halelectricus]
MLNFDELEKGFTEEEALEEARRCLKCKNPPCVKGCPIENRIPAIVRAIEAKDYRTAIDIINENSNLAVICARVCPHNDQCEGACVLNRKGQGIRISKLERFLAEKEMELALNRLRGKVAVIGSGPAGLSVAAILAKQNYRVTIFEAQHKAGGVLRYGIPEYRLPNEVVDKQIEIVRNLGVRLETGVVIGEDLTLDQLFAMGYQAVFIGTGTGLARKLGVAGESLPGAMQAIYFLETVNLIRDGSLPGRPYPVRTGDRVLVVGAGNVAVDAARTALRLGAAQVDVVDIVPEKERRASDKEYAEALHEGVRFHFETSVTRILGDRQVEGVVLQNFTRQVQGRESAIIPLPGTERELAYDKVIIAIGQKPFARIVSTTTGIKTSAQGYVLTETEPYYGMTTREGVFAAGDVVHEPKTVILAMREGRRVAEAIDAWLQRGKEA